MQDNPYAPPVADVQDVRLAGVSHENAPWFPVSVTKLFVMSMCTFTLYQVYWLYQNWRRVQQRESVNIIPALRAIFGVFFCYQLFAKIGDFDARTSTGTLNAGGMAAGWIIFTLLWKLPEPYWLVALAAIFFMLPVQAHANAINAAMVPNCDRNSRFSALNWVAVVLGGFLLIVGIIGTFLPDPA